MWQQAMLFAKREPLVIPGKPNIYSDYIIMLFFMNVSHVVGIFYVSYYVSVKITNMALVAFPCF
jgi:hypothetical protein